VLYAPFTATAFFGKIASEQRRIIIIDHHLMLCNVFYFINVYSSINSRLFRFVAPYQIFSSSFHFVILLPVPNVPSVAVK
jgi:hypothetical protein